MGNEFVEGWPCAYRVPLTLLLAIATSPCVQVEQTIQVRRDGSVTIDAVVKARQSSVILVLRRQYSSHRCFVSGASHECDPNRSGCICQKSFSMDGDAKELVVSTSRAT